MELSQAANSIPAVRFIKIGIILALAIAVFFILRKIGLFKSESEKIEDKKEAEAKEGASEFEKSDVLEPIKISKLLETGVGAAELKNQFPYTPKQVADMISKIKKDQPTIGYAVGTRTLAVVKSLPSKFAFTRLGLSFNNAYGKDLMAWIKDNIKDVTESDIEHTLSLKPDFVKPLKSTEDYLAKNKLTLTL